MMLPTKTNALSTMACRKGPSIRLSVRRDSTKKTFRRVQDSVQAHNLTGKSSMPVIHIEKEQAQKSAPNGLVQKRRVHVLPVHHNRPRQIGRSAVGLTVEEISPTTDTLCQRHSRQDQIRHGEERNVLFSADRPGGHHGRKSIRRESPVPPREC